MRTSTFLLAASTAGSVLGVPLVKKDNYDPLPGGDIDILNYALTLEFLERKFYEQGLANYTKEELTVARKPVFKGTTAFFTVVMAFCKMLTTIPPDQALSTLIIRQMMRYYDRCFGWFKSLVSKTQETATDTQTLRLAAKLALEPSQINETIKGIWASETTDTVLMDKEIGQLIAYTNNQKTELSDILQDKDTISSICLLYTSMKWALEAKSEPGGTIVLKRWRKTSVGGSNRLMLKTLGSTSDLWVPELRLRPAPASITVPTTTEAAVGISAQ
ncbi:exocyst complex component sec8 like protein [Verticillium longisporum]|nr:exocyst complex component sec8 like protein [Verticillium longisporum]